MPSKISFFLIGSLAVNAALLGIVGGRWFSPASAEPTAQMQLERYGPTPDVVAAAWAQLPDADRKELRKQLRESWSNMEGERQRLRAAGEAVYNAALAEPFDQNRLRDAWRFSSCAKSISKTTPRTFSSAILERCRRRRAPPRRRGLADAVQRTHEAC